MCLVPVFYNDRHVQCNKCPECLRGQRQDWIYRCEQESKLHPHNYFITLTFNPEHLPADEEGVWECFTNFRKSIWKEQGKFPYFCSMERGDLNGRLHLHLLFYSDKPLSKLIIRKCWPYGFIKRSMITPKRIRYSVSYMFDPDMFNKIKMYRSSNDFGGVPALPYRIRKLKGGRLDFVPLPRYYNKKFAHCKKWSREYYDNLYHDNDFESVYIKARERYQRLRFGYGKKVNNLTYEDFLYKFIESRIRKYPTFTDPRDLIAFPGPSHVKALSHSYRELLRRVSRLSPRYGARLPGNLKGYLTIDCRMSLRDSAHRVAGVRKPPPDRFIYFKDFFKKQLTFLNW